MAIKPKFLYLRELMVLTSTLIYDDLSPEDRQRRLKELKFCKENLIKTEATKRERYIFGKKGFENHINPTDSIKEYVEAVGELGEERKKRYREKYKKEE